MTVLSQIVHAMESFERETGTQPKVLLVSSNLVEQLLCECVRTRPLTPVLSGPTKHEICGLPAYTVIEPDIIKCSV